jgi:hypothetical protein
MSSAFLLGAGSTFGTFQGRPLCPPIARDFGRVLTDRAPNWAAEYPELVKVATHLGKTLPDVGLEELWTCIDYHVKFRESIDVHWDHKVVPQLKASLLRLYGRACDSEAENLPEFHNFTLGEVVNQLRPGDALVSFNYDTVAERLTRRHGIALLHASHQPDHAVRFAKPHGSGSWNLHALGAELIDGSPLFNSIDENSVEVGSLEPLLLGAVPLKSELIREVQQCYNKPDVFKVVLQQWRSVADVIRGADRLVVVGYSFPPEDTYGRFFFREAMRQRSKPLRIEYYELPDKSPQPQQQSCRPFPAT